MYPYCVDRESPATDNGSVINNCRTALGIVAVLASTSLAGIVPPYTATSASDFTVDYNGFTGTPVAVVGGLTAQVRFYNFAFANGTGTHSGQTKVNFDLDVKNNSSSPVTASRISGLGFNTSPAIVSTNDNKVSGAGFDSVTLAGNMPNGVGTVEFCFSNNNCAGGASGGVLKGASATVSAELYFTGSITKLTFDNFFVRYQSLDCATCLPAITGGSASGTAVASVVPEPGFYGALAVGLTGLVVAVRRKRNAA